VTAKRRRLPKGHHGRSDGWHEPTVRDTAANFQTTSAVPAGRLAGVLLTQVHRAAGYRRHRRASRGDPALDAGKRESGTGSQAAAGSTNPVRQNEGVRFSAGLPKWLGVSPAPCRYAQSPWSELRFRISVENRSEAPAKLQLGRSPQNVSPPPCGTAGGAEGGRCQTRSRETAGSRRPVPRRKHHEDPKEPRSRTNTP